MNEEKNNFQREIPYYAFEAVLSRFERTIRRLWILAIILIGLLLATNAGWLWYESQYEEVYIDQAADGNSSNYALGGDYNGSETDD